jgi:hypothetical protein
MTGTHRNWLSEQFESARKEYDDWSDALKSSFDSLGSRNESSSQPDPKSVEASPHSSEQEPR